ncbi:MAG: ribonuclease HII [Thermomicrobiales bacterium]
MTGTATRAAPGLHHEAALAAAGFRLIAGVDEAGRGAWAGPLLAAAVVLPAVENGTADQLLADLAGVNDSKQLSHRQREALLLPIMQHAVAVGIGQVEADELDAIGLGAANRLAWRRAIAALPQPPDHLLLDAFRLPALATPQTAIVRGDSESLSIAAASIIAKVTRDRLLATLDRAHPLYGFARHKGYGTAMHQAALRAHGPCAAHRRSFAPLRALAAGTP